MVNYGQSNIQTARFAHLQALRGIAAVVATVNHWCALYYPNISHPFTPAEKLEQPGKTPVSILVNGQLPVRFFFVLSSFVLSHGHFAAVRSGRTSPLSQRAMRRYPRLLFPVIGATLASLLVWKLGFYGYMRRVSYASGTTWLMHPQLPSEVCIGNALEEALWVTWYYGNQYVGPLWTMRWELSGSWFSMLLALVASNTGKKRPVVYICVCAWLMHKSVFLQYGGEYYQQCTLGVAFADAHVSGLLKPFRNIWLHIGMFAAFVYFGMYPTYAGSFADIWYGNLWYTFSVSALFGLTTTNMSIKRALETRALVWLGGISFSLYVLHDTVQNSVCAWAFTHMLGPLGFDIAAIVTLFLVEFPILILISVPFGALFDIFLGQEAVRYAHSALCDNQLPTVNAENDHWWWQLMTWRTAKRVLSAINIVALEIKRLCRAHRGRAVAILALCVFMATVDLVPSFLAEEPCTIPIVRVYEYSTGLYRVDRQDGPIARALRSSAEFLVEGPVFSTFPHNPLPGSGWVAELSACPGSTNAVGPLEHYSLVNPGDLNLLAGCRSLGHVMLQQRRSNGWLESVEIRPNPNAIQFNSSFIASTAHAVASLWDSEAAETTFLAPDARFTYC